MQRWKIGSRHLFICQGDLATFECDAIVNAANSRLAGGGGVDGAIHRAAGIVQLQQACQSIIVESGNLPTGNAVITPGYQLTAKHIIHTVGPIWRGGDSNERELLSNAYRNSMTLAHQHSISTIAFPAISCGAYGFPIQDAAHIALTALKSGLEAGLVDEAGMVLHGSEAYDLWLNAAQEVL